MRKTKDLFKKIGDIKGIFHARRGMVKDRNDKDLKEEEINKRWQEYTELYKNILMTWITMMVLSLTLSQMSWRVKSSWSQEALLQTKLVEIVEFQLHYFKPWEMMLLKVLYSVCQQIWKTQQWSQGWKRSVFIPIPKKGNDKECSSYNTIEFTSHASKVMLKILKARLYQCMN